MTNYGTSKNTRKTMAWNQVKERHAQELAERHERNLRQEEERQRQEEEQKIRQIERDQKNAAKRAEQVRLNEQNEALRMEQLKADPIGAKLFNRIMESIENDPKTRATIAHRLVDKEEVTIADVQDQDHYPYWTLHCLIPGIEAKSTYCDCEGRLSEFNITSDLAWSFYYNPVGPSAIQHPDCEGYELVVEIEGHFAPQIWRIYVRKIPPPSWFSWFK